MRVKKFYNFVAESKEPKVTATSSVTLPTITLPTININADKKTGQLLPNWNKLTSEEKKLFWDESGIGRRIRLKAGMKYPDVFELSEENIDIVTELLSASLDSIPSGLTQAASFVIDLLHALSYFIRWKNAKKEEDKVEYFAIALLSLIFLWLPRQGNIIMTRMPNLVKKAIQRMETLKNHINTPFIGKVAYVVTTVLVSQKIYELPDYKKLSSDMAEKRKNNPLYATILGDYDKYITEMLTAMQEVYRRVKYVLEHEEEMKKRGLEYPQQKK
jgi:hypothetical protein